MRTDAFLQIRTALDTTTSTTGGDQRTNIGAVFIQKEIDRMIKETINRDVDFRPLVQRKTMNQKARIWNLRTSLGATAKTSFQSEGGTGTPQPSEFMQLFAPALTLRSDYEVTGLAQAAASSYFDAMDSEARDALSAYALTEEQAFILGNDSDNETSGITINGKIGVSGSYLGLKQLLSSAVAEATGTQGGFGDSTARYGITPSSTVTDEEYKMNVRTINTSNTTQNPLSIQNLNSAITQSNIQGGKRANRIYLCSEERLDEISDLIQPHGRYVQGASSVELDGGLSVLTWKNIKIISSRLQAFNGVTSSGAGVTFTDTDNSMLLLNMDVIFFWNVAGVDVRHVPITGADASQRSDVFGGYYKTYGVFTVESFNTHVVIWNLSTP